MTELDVDLARFELSTCDPCRTCYGTGVHKQSSNHFERSTFDVYPDIGQLCFSCFGSGYQRDADRNHATLIEAMAEARLKMESPVVQAALAELHERYKDWRK